MQFSHRGKDVSVNASYRGYAAAWLKEHPHSARTRSTKSQHEEKALDQAKISVCSFLRDWIKGEVTAIEVGILTFEGAFLGQILPEDGKSVLDRVTAAGMLKIEGGAP